MKSWKTTVLGLITGIMLILPQVATVIDGDPETNPEYQVLLAGFAAMGIGGLARDNDKSSQDVGIR